MENLKYIIEDEIIAEILGNQNFSTKESAVLELVKNSYDAGATNVDLLFHENKIIISDNGRGMDSDIIRENWMHIGNSSKKYEFDDIEQNKRIYAGSKGIGRFALSKLGKEVDLYSKAENKTGIYWHTDWKTSTLDDADLENLQGTKIIISSLRDRWTDKSIENLKGFLSRTYNSDLMMINIIYKNINYPVKKYFDEAKLGINCLSYINMRYNAEKMILTYEICSDEFADEAKIYYDPIKLNKYSDEVNVELINFKDNIDASQDEIPILLKKLGNFEVKLFFSLKGAIATDAEKFCYKYAKLPERYQEGIILYRNAFSIASFEGKKDWLELGKRSRKSPAAASHETGTWRVRENQISGYVQIDKKENHVLRDLSNRQGIEENIYYNLFVKIIQEGIGEFESYRQNIIRCIDKKNIKQAVQHTPLLDEFINKPHSLFNFSKEDAGKLAEEIQKVKKQSEEGDKRNKDTEEKYKYDVRILNMLSTIGLRAASIAHEMHNEENNISSNYENIVNALKEFGVWEVLNLEENTQFAYNNVPELLKNNNKINKKIIRFMDTMLSNIEKEQFIAKEVDIIEILNEIKNVWSRDYSWITINIPNGSIMFRTAEDVVKVLMDNLLLNSVQQNENKDTLEITIEAWLDNDDLNIRYKDNGCGLNKKYVNNPKKILEVHESSRTNGHGLGMWIVNNTLVMTGGEVVEIPITNGFEILMKLGDKL